VTATEKKTRSKERNRSALTAVEWLTGGLLTAASLAMYGLHLAHAGALWRDEASTVSLATLPTLGDVWAKLPYDHCPPLVHVMIRAWAAAGLGGDDGSLRLLGTFVGVLLVGAIWVAGRAGRGRVPILPLALVGLNASIIATVDSFRGYGIGCVTAVVMIALVWRLCARPGWRTAAAASVAAVLSVQALYQNAVFVLAACAGAAVVLAVTRRWRALAWVAATGGVSALSLLPYVPTLQRSQEWYLLEQSGFTWPWALEKIAAATGFPHPTFTLAWAAVGTAALGLLLRQLAMLRREGLQTEPARVALFGGVTLLVSVGAFSWFLVRAGLPTQPWYYVPALVVAAVCVDLMLPAWAAARGIVVAVAAVALALAWPYGTEALRLRRTNIDRLAAQVAASAEPTDLVVVHPWYYGATFARYYHGRAPWTTVPPLGDHRLHRYDLFKAEMRKAQPLQPVLEQVAATLRAGRQVWIVGMIPLDGTPPIPVNPAPDNPWGWLDEQYSIAWGTQVGAFLLTYAEHGVVVSGPEPSGVDPLENLPLLYVVGWKGGPG
jgi:hypothetical protein